MSKSKKFTFYWRTGQREVLTGRDLADALNQAGYGGGAVRALDFHASGDNNEWQWEAGSREWTPRPDSAFGKQIAAAKAAQASEAGGFSTPK